MSSLMRSSGRNSWMILGTFQTELLRKLLPFLSSTKVKTKILVWQLWLRQKSWKLHFHLKIQSKIVLLSQFWTKGSKPFSKCSTARNLDQENQNFFLVILLIKALKKKKCKIFKFQNLKMSMSSLRSKIRFSWCLSTTDTTSSKENGAPSSNLTSTIRDISKRETSLWKWLTKKTWECTGRLVCWVLYVFEKKIYVKNYLKKTAKNI